MKRHWMLTAMGAAMLSTLSACEEPAANAGDAAEGSGAAVHAHAGHGHAHAPTPAQAQPQTEPVWLSLAPEPKTVQLLLIAAFTDNNGGMNFNGQTRGGATVTVPLGWRVNATFQNRSAAPHSAVVVEPEKTKDLRVGEPYFKGASTPAPEMGTTTQIVDFSFVADEKGKYAIVCGFPGHGLAGHWIHFIVGDENTKPSYKVGDKVTEAK